MLHRKYLKMNKNNKIITQETFKLQGQYEISQHWFDFDFDLIEQNFSTIEPDFYKTIYHRNDKTKDRIYI